MSIQKKFIGANQVGAEKIRLESDSALRARNAANSADVELLKLDSSDILKMLKLPRLDSALAAPSDAKDLVTKEYVDSTVGGDVGALEVRVQAIEDDYGVAGGLATLDMSGKIPASQLPSAIMEYKGTWDASTNTPSLSNGSGSNLPEDAGHVYKVSIGGTVDFGAGNITFNAGDLVILSASLIWEKSVSGDQVDSVNGYTGAVTLVTSDIAESGVTNLYYTPTRQAAIEDYADAAVAAEAGLREAEDLTFLKLDGSRPMTGSFDLDGNGIVNAIEITGMAGEDISLISSQNVVLSGIQAVIQATPTIWSNQTNFKTSDGSIQYGSIAHNGGVSGTEAGMSFGPNDPYAPLTLLGSEVKISQGLTGNGWAGITGFSGIEHTGVFTLAAGASIDLRSEVGAVQFLDSSLNIQGGIYTASPGLSLGSSIGNLSFGSATALYGYEDDNGDQQLSIDLTGAAAKISSVVGGLTLQSATNEVSLSSGKIVSLADPTSAQDAATKAYVDAAVGGVNTAFEIGFTPAGNIAATNVQSAIEELDSEKLALAGGTMSGTLDMGYNTIAHVGGISSDGAFSVTSSGGGGSVTVDTTSASIQVATQIIMNAVGDIQMSTSGDIVFVPAGDVDVSTKKIVNLGAPSASSDAATKGYVDDAFTAADLGQYLKHDGSVPMSGDLDLDGNSLLNVTSMGSVASTNLDVTSGNVLGLVASAQVKLDGTSVDFYISGAKVGGIVDDGGQLSINAETTMVLGSADEIVLLNPTNFNDSPISGVSSIQGSGLLTGFSITAPIGPLNLNADAGQIHLTSATNFLVDAAGKILISQTGSDDPLNILANSQNINVVAGLQFTGEGATAVLNATTSYAQVVSQAAEVKLDGTSIDFYQSGTYYGKIDVGGGGDMFVESNADLYLNPTGVVKVQQELSMQNQKIVNLATPTASGDAATKGYVDGQLDTLGVQQLVHETKTLGAGDLVSIDVGFAIQGQPWIQVGRVSLVPGDDFTVSGTTITWAGSVAPLGVEALEAGDKLSIFYMKAVNPFV